jgi:hypothetical protein
VPPASVKALRPESRNGFRVVLVQEWVSERFWVVPTALLAAGLAVGVAAGSARTLLTTPLVAGPDRRCATGHSQPQNGPRTGWT